MKVQATVARQLQDASLENLAKAHHDNDLGLKLTQALKGGAFIDGRNLLNLQTQAPSLNRYFAGLRVAAPGATGRRLREYRKRPKRRMDRQSIERWQGDRRGAEKDEAHFIVFLFCVEFDASACR